MATSGLDCCSVFAKIILILLNIFYLLVSLCLVGAGIYVLVNSDNIEEVTGSDLSISAIVIIVIGAVTLLTAIMGIIATATNFWPLLIVYCFIILILIGIQITVGILTFVYKAQIKERVTPQLILLISNYTEDKSSPQYNERRNKVIDFIQKSFKCCGLTNASNWVGLNTAYVVEYLRPPESCLCEKSAEECKTYNVTQKVQSVTFTLSVNAWREGCVPAVEHYLRHNLVSLGAGAVSFASIQILTVIFTIGLCSCIIAKNKQSQNITRVQDLAYSQLDPYPTNIFDPARHSSDQQYSKFVDEDDENKML